MAALPSTGHHCLPSPVSSSKHFNTKSSTGPGKGATSLQSVPRSTVCMLVVGHVCMPLGGSMGYMTLLIIANPLSESPKPPSCSTRSESVSTEVSSDTLFRRPSWRTSRRMSFSCRRRHDGRLRSYGSTTVEPMSQEFKHHCLRNRVEKRLLCGFEHLSHTRCLDSCCCTQQRLQPMPTL